MEDTFSEDLQSKIALVEQKLLFLVALQQEIPITKEDKVEIVSRGSDYYEVRFHHISGGFIGVNISTTSILLAGLFVMSNNY